MRRERAHERFCFFVNFCPILRPNESNTRPPKARLLYNIRIISNILDRGAGPRLVNSGETRLYYFIHAHSIRALADLFSKA